MTFEEFWPYYVGQHQNETNRRLHFVGTTFGLLCLAFSPLQPRLLLAGLVGSYGFAWVGHFFFEKNQPATWQYPLLSFRADFKMYWLMLRRRPVLPTT